MNNPQQDDARSNVDSIQVLNLSFPRCGTLTAKVALDRLGYNCWHSFSCLGRPELCRHWMAALDAKFYKGQKYTRADWDKVLQSFTAVSTGPPAIAFAEDLLSAYPDAKVLLVERDEDVWFESFRMNIMQNLFRWDLNAVANIDPTMFGPQRDMQWRHIKGWWGVSTYKGMSAKAKQMYREHNAKIRALTPPDRLLVYRLEDGWEPLCKFLGKEVPDEPFPRRNDSREYEKRRWFIWLCGLQLLSSMALKVMGPLLAGVVAWRYFGAPLMLAPS